MNDRQTIAHKIALNPAAALEDYLPDCRPGSMTRVPTHIREGLARYLLLGTMPGSFLRAVLSNDLMAAVSRADDECQPALIHIVKFLYNDCPGGCFGSSEHLDEWVAKGGWLGIREAAA